MRVGCVANWLHFAGAGLFPFASQSAIVQLFVGFWEMGPNHTLPTSIFLHMALETVLTPDSAMDVVRYAILLACFLAVLPDLVHRRVLGQKYLSWYLTGVSSVVTAYLRSQRMRSAVPYVCDGKDRLLYLHVAAVNAILVSGCR